MNKWDERFTDTAATVSTWSKDPERKVGAVLVSPDRRSVSWGYNGLPRGVNDNILDSITKAERNRLMLHAERNAIDNHPTKVYGWTMYVTRCPCSQCAGSIIQNGIARVVTPPPDFKSSWFEDMVTATDMLRQAGVVVHHIG